MENPRLDFTVYIERAQIINKLTDKDAGQVFKALLDYISGIEPNFTSKKAEIVYTILVQDIEMR